MMIGMLVIDMFNEQGRPDLALMREAAPPVRPRSKPSQAASPEHLRKSERLPQLRAPFQYKRG